MQFWLVIYIEPSEGRFQQYFNCHADNEDHAIEQCVNAYPNCEIVSAYVES